MSVPPRLAPLLAPDAPVQRIARALFDAGHECHLVGGSVRDALVDDVPVEFDFATDARPDRTEALLGPAICGACYEVPAAMQADIEGRLPHSAVRTRAGTPGLDLRAGLAHQLAAADVAQVVHDPRCTAEDPDLYSYRRDGRTGRQAGVVWIT